MKKSVFFNYDGKNVIGFPFDLKPKININMTHTKKDIGFLDEENSYIMRVI